MAVQNKTKTHFIPTSQLKLYNVGNQQGEDLGQVQNFIVDMCATRIAYVLVAFEGFLGLTDKWIPMPFEVLTWVPDKNRFEADITRKQLEQAPTIAKSEWPDKFLAKLELQDHSSWLESVYRYYNRTPYWALAACEVCATEPAEQIVVETVTSYVYTETTETNSTDQPRTASAATLAAREALKAATKSEEASNEAKSAKEALAAACSAANRAGEISRADNQASDRAAQYVGSAEEAARKAQGSSRAAKIAAEDATAAINKAQELARADVRAFEKAAQDAGSAEEAARKAQEAALACKNVADAAAINAVDADRRLAAASKRAEDTARAAEYAADEDSSKAAEAATVARGSVLTAVKALEDAGTCEQECVVITATPV
jgi:hypothetical protein